MRADVVTILPDYFAPLDLSIVGRARRAGLLDARVHDLRDWTTDRHRTVDDTPYGGGAGMVMRPEPWGAALDAVLADPPADVAPAAPGSAGAGDVESAGDAAGEPAPADAAAAPAGARPVRPRLVFPTPSGRPFTQALAAELATEPWLVFACGRYEGIDARVVAWARTRTTVDEVSLGDYVLGGGEVAVLAILEAVVRLLPGALGNPGSLDEESHADGLLEHPVFTKPASWRDLEVPEVLRGGNHHRVARWRRDEALRRTALHRPDLIAALDPATLNAKDRSVLHHLGWTVDREGGFLRRRPPLAE